jgi:hypothetical protein
MCGYGQVPGVNFQESFAPVIKDVTLMMLTWNLKGKIVDIKTAFLCGNLKEIIYMEIPKGMEANENECWILRKQFTGLSRAQENFTKSLFWRSVDPCLWRKYTEHGIVFVGIYVNDCLNGINDVINGLKTYKFGLKIANDWKDYLRCRILTDYERKTTFVM